MIKKLKFIGWAIRLNETSEVYGWRKEKSS